MDDHYANYRHADWLEKMNSTPYLKFDTFDVYWFSNGDYLLLFEAATDLKAGYLTETLGSMLLDRKAHKKPCYLLLRGHTGVIAVSSNHLGDMRAALLRAWPSVAM